MYTCEPYIHVLPSTDLESTVLQECYAPGVTEFFCPMDDAPRKTVLAGLWDWLTNSPRKMDVYCTNVYHIDRTKQRNLNGDVEWIETTIWFQKFGKNAWSDKQKDKTMLEPYR